MKNPLERFKKFVKEYRPILLGTAFLGLSAFFMFYMSLNPSSKKNHVACTGSTAVESSILNKYSLDPEKTANSGVTITENKQDHFGGATKQTSKSDCDQKEDAQLENQEDKLQNNKKNQDNQQDTDGLSQIKMSLEHLNRVKNTEDNINILNQSPKINQWLRFWGRYVDVNSNIIVKDISSVELLNGYGFHDSTTLGFANFKTNVRLPGTPKTFQLKLSHIALDLLSSRISERNFVKSLINSLDRFITIDYFSTQMITKPCKDRRSELVHNRIHTNQHHHELMKTQFCNLVYATNPSVWSNQMLGHVNYDTYSNAITVLERSLFPSGDRLETHYKTYGQSLIYGNQIKTERSGFLTEIDLLHLFCTITKQTECVNQHLKERLNIGFINTRTNTMNTLLFEVKCNISHLVFDVIRAATKQIPIVKKASPVVNTITELAQKYVPLEVYFQTGFQKGDSINFNNQLETSRNDRMNQYNLEIQQQILFHQENNLCPRAKKRNILRNRRTLLKSVPEMNPVTFNDMRFPTQRNLPEIDYGKFDHMKLNPQNQVTFLEQKTVFRRARRKDFFRNVPEINCGHFSHTRWMLMYNFSAFDILERITAARDKLRS